VGDILRCAELGRAVTYFEIAPTLGLKPQACTNLHISYSSHDRDACGFFYPQADLGTAGSRWGSRWTWHWKDLGAACYGASSFAQE